MSHYILTEMMAQSVHLVNNCEFEDARSWSSEDFDLESFLGNERKYDAFTLCPVAIRKNSAHTLIPDRDVYTPTKPNAQGCFFVGYTVVRSRYALSIHDSSVTPWAILGALHAALAIRVRHTGSEIYPIEVDAKSLPTNRIVDECTANSWTEIPQMSAASVWQTGFGIAAAEDALSWRLASLLLEDNHFTFAGLYLREAMKYSNDVLYEKVPDSGDSPFEVSDLVKMESSIHCCYKVVEAIYGGQLPSKNSRGESKILERFESLHLDLTKDLPTANNSLPSVTRWDKLTQLRKARDQRAAHGGKGQQQRGATFSEVEDYIDFVRHLLLNALWGCYGKRSVEDLAARSSCWESECFPNSSIDRRIRTKSKGE